LAQEVLGSSHQVVHCPSRFNAVMRAHLIDGASKQLVGKAAVYDGPLWDEDESADEALHAFSKGQVKTSKDYPSVDTSASVGPGAELWESESGDEKPDPIGIGQPNATMENREALLHIKSMVEKKKIQFQNRPDLSTITHLNGEAVYEDHRSEELLLPQHASNTTLKGMRPPFAPSNSSAIPRSAGEDLRPPLACSSAMPRSALEAQPRAGYIADLSPAAPLTAASLGDTRRQNWGVGDITSMLFEDADDGEVNDERPSDVFFDCDSDVEVVTDKVHGTFDDAVWLDMVKRRSQARSSKRHSTDMSMVTHVNGDAPEEQRPDLLDSLLHGESTLQAEDRAGELVRNYMTVAGAQSKVQGANVLGTFADSRAVEAVKRQAEAKAKAQSMISDDLSNNAHVGSDWVR